MKVSVLAFGVLREAAGLPPAGIPVEVGLEGGATVRDAVMTLGIDHARLQVILIDGERAGPEDLLHDGAELTLMPAFTGGC